MRFDSIENSEPEAFRQSAVAPRIPHSKLSTPNFSPQPSTFVFVCELRKPATPATLLMVNDLTRYKCRYKPLQTRYIFGRWSFVIH
jgi:hypothetical protein